MQFIKNLIIFAVLSCPSVAFTQSTYLQQGAKEYQIIDRIQIKQQGSSELNFSTLKPYNRKAIVQHMEYVNSTEFGKTRFGFEQYKSKKWKELNLSSVDEYNLKSLLMNNSEWVKDAGESFESRSAILRNFYRTKANLIEENNKDLFLAVNPILNFQAGKESAHDETIFLNTRGISARAMIAQRIGFSTWLTDNQERGPLFFQNRVKQFNAVPGVGFYKPFKSTAYDYFDARGYFTFNLVKYVDFQFGYDKNFIGNGYRSLFLSDCGNSYLFLKINTRVWKINYQNLFMEVFPQLYTSTSTLLDRKYASLNHLSMNVTKSVNVGVLGGIIFSSKNIFNLRYLNPIIFLNQIGGQKGSSDNAMGGIDVKANIAHHIQLYGQFLLDGFVLSEIKKNRGYWANKFGIQTGFKYVDAFNIPNFDIQLESNRVRPFTYTHFDSIADYTHYNQPLAHPLGANFQEYIGIIKYQPVPKLYFSARVIYYKQGLDSAGRNFGGNIFEDYNTRIRDYGFKTGSSGNQAVCLNASLVISYELKENLFIEGSVLHRNYKLQTGTPENTTMSSLGIRWNIFRREYDY